MAWLMVSTFGYALALPFLQDDRSRQRNQGALNRQAAPASRPSAKNGNQNRNQGRNGNNAATVTMPIRMGMRSRASMPSRFR